MNMNSYPRTLTMSEEILFERFSQYDEKKLAPTVQDVLNEYKDDIFIKDSNAQ